MKPNRISSVLPRLPLARGHVRERTEPQARRAGKALTVRNQTEDAANPQRVRARNVRADLLASARARAMLITIAAGQFIACVISAAIAGLVGLILIRWPR